MSTAAVLPFGRRRRRKARPLLPTERRADGSRVQPTRCMKTIEAVRRMNILRNLPCPPEPAPSLFLRGRPFQHKSLQAAGVGSSESEKMFSFKNSFHSCNDGLVSWHGINAYCKYLWLKSKTLRYSTSPKCEKPHVNMIPAAYSPPLLERLGSYRERQLAQLPVSHCQWVRQRSLRHLHPGPQEL